MNLDLIFTNIPLVMLLILVASILITYAIIPKIIWVVKEKDLIDHPEDRSSHENSTPTMAGVAFFLTLMVMLFFVRLWDVDGIGYHIVTGLTIIFALGLKDDLVLSTPRAKIVGEIVAIGFLLSNPALQLNSFNGFLGITSFSPVFGYFFACLMILTIINAYNLIDGIDGLASLTGICIFLVYGIIFYFLEMYFYVMMCMTLIGILIAFFRYNISHTKKIFMGDTGSLIIGFCIGLMSLRFLVMGPSNLEVFSFYPQNKLILIGVIAFLPLFDTFRVMGIRILNKKSPFFPDRNHVHHILIDKGFSHIKAALILSIGNFQIAVLFTYLATKFKSVELLAILLIFTGLMLLLFNKLRKKNIKEGRTISMLGST